MKDQKRGIGRKGLKLWSLVFLMMWLISRTLARGILGDAQGEELSNLLGSSPAMMHIATVVLILESLSVCGVLIYAFRILDGVRQTGSIKKYLLRMGILALVSEIPYDLLMTEKAFDLSLQNPVLGLLVCQLVAYYWNLYEGKGVKPLLIRLAVLLAACAWCFLLKVEFGLPLVLCTVVLWMFRKDESKRGLGAMIAGGLCILVSPFFLAAPMGAMVLHFYNGEEWEERNLLSYILFPVLLILGYAVTILL